MDIQEVISSAFTGVSLGSGTSLRQAQAIDNYGEGLSEGEFKSLPLNEITDDWSKVSFEELELNCVAHLDAEGYRYYIPAFMLSVLLHYEPSSMRVIGTLGSLYPSGRTKSLNLKQYSLLNTTQREAIALFLNGLADIAHLDSEDLVIVERALKVYWNQYLYGEVKI